MGVYRYWEVLKEVSSKNKEYLMKIGFFNWKYVLGGGLNKRIFSIYLSLPSELRGIL